DRLRELVSIEPDFPQANAMLSAAEKGTLRPDREGFLRATSDPEPLGAQSNPQSARQNAPTRSAGQQPAPPQPVEQPIITIHPDEIDTEHDQLALSAALTPAVATVDAKPTPKRSMSMPEIPRAPIFPRFAVPENMTPSYAPGARSASLQFELDLELPEDPRDTIPQPEAEPPPSSANTAEPPPTVRDPHALPLTVRDPNSAPPTFRDPNPARHAASELSTLPPETEQHTPGPESIMERARTCWDQGGHHRA